MARVINYFNCNLKRHVVLIVLFLFNKILLAQNLDQKTDSTIKFTNPLEIKHTDNSNTQQGFDTPLRKEVFSAFKHYWMRFEEYEKTLSQAKKDEIKQQWLDIQKQYQKQQNENFKNKYNSLLNAEKYYKDILQNYYDSYQDKAIVMFNLAQTLHMIANEVQATDAVLAEQKRSEAVNVLSQIENDFPSFEHMPEVLYLKALSLEQLNLQDKAIVVWEKLSSIKSIKPYTVAANIFAGDYYFNQDEAPKALKYYLNALSLISKNTQNISYDEEKIRIQYRIAWASYRIANYTQTLQSALEILKPMKEFKNQKELSDIKEDAIELIASTLFELNNLEKTYQVLRLKYIQNYAAKIGWYLIQKYFDSGMYETLIQIGEFVVNNFYFYEPIPQILDLCAKAAEKIRRTDMQIGFLEKLSILLSAQSLWRAKNKDNFNAIKLMENLAKQAALYVAQYYYDLGMKTSNAGYFSLSSVYYQILVDFTPSDISANEWRLKIANCYYLSSKIDDAIAIYEDLYKNYVLENHILKITLYQLALSYEKKWKMLFIKEYATSQNPYENSGVNTYLLKLNEIVNNFADKYPQGKETIELLLLAASANRDQHRYDIAIQYYNRVFLLNSDSNQQGVAIRGIVYAIIQSSSSKEVIEKIINLLKVKNISQIDESLNSEILTILSQTIISQAQQSKESGDYLEIGKIMVNTAKEFKNLPQRERIFKDGAYFLALGQDWPSAQKACLEFINEGLTKHKGDMIYLLARSYEYQLKFSNAIKYYIMLSQNYPKHIKAKYAAQKALELSSEENKLDKSAVASDIIATVSDAKSEKFRMYLKSAEYYQNMGNYQKAVVQAQKAFGVASSIDEKFKAQIVLYKSMYNTSKVDEALKGLEELNQSLNKNKNKLDQETFALYVSEINYLLAEDARKVFEDYNLLERSGSLQIRVNTKAKYFEKMVKYYDVVASFNLSVFAPEARFKIAETSDKFADELTMLLNMNKVEGKTYEEYFKISQRLKNLSKRYLTNNIIASNKEPHKFKNNEWVYKSALKLGGGVPGDLKHTLNHSLSDTLPASLNYQLQSQWSL